MISVWGQSLLSTWTLAMRWTVSRPPTTWPKTVCLALRCGHAARVMKNLGRMVLSSHSSLGATIPDRRNTH